MERNYMTTLEPKTNLRLSGVLNLTVPGRSTTSGPSSLVQAVQAAVRRVDEGILKPTFHRDARLAFRPKTLLALLCFCYARQIYGSTDIENVLVRDVYFRRLCLNQIPDAPVIRHFCRENREAIRLCLTSVLSFLADQKVAEGTVTRVNKAHLAEEASRRIIMAMFIDSMELDGHQTLDAHVDLCYLFANGHPQAH